MHKTWNMITLNKNWSMGVFVTVGEVTAISDVEMFYLFSWNPACEQAIDGPQ